MNPQWPYPQYPVPPPYSSQPLQQTPWNIQDASAVPPTVNANVLPSTPAFTPVSFPFHVPPPNIISTNVPPPTFCPNFAPPNYPVSASHSSQLTEPSSSVKSPPPLPSESPPPLPSEPPPPLPSASPPPLPIDPPCHLPSDSSAFLIQTESASLVSSGLVLDDSSPIVPESSYVSTQIPVLTESPTSSADSKAILSNGLSSVLSNGSLQSAAVDVLPAMSTVSLPVESTESLLPVATKPLTVTLTKSSTLPVESLSTMPSRLLSEKDDFVPVETSIAPVVSATCLSPDSSPVLIRSTMSSVLSSPVCTASNSLIVSEAVSSLSSVTPNSTFAEIEKLPPMVNNSSHVESAGFSSAVPTVSLTTESSALSIESMSSKVLCACDKSSVSVASSVSPIVSATCASTGSSLLLIQPTFSSTVNSSESAISSLCMASESVSSVATDNTSSSTPSELLLSKSSISSPVESTQFSFSVPAESLNPIQIESIPIMPSRIFEQIKSSVATESSVAPVVATTCISANSSPVLNQPSLSPTLNSSASAVSHLSIVSESSTSVSPVAPNSILFCAPTDVLPPKFIISSPIKSAEVSFTVPTELIPTLTEPLKDQSPILPSSLAELSVASVSATCVSNDSSSLLHQPKVTPGLNSSGSAVSSPSVLSKFVSSLSSVSNRPTSTPITEKLPSMSTTMVELAQFSPTMSTDSSTPTSTKSLLPNQPLPDMAARPQQDTSSVPIELSIAPVVSSTSVSTGSPPVLIPSTLPSIFRSSASAASNSISASKSVSPGQTQIPSICYVLVPVKFSPQPASPVQSNMRSIHIRPNHTFTFQTSNEETSAFNSPHVTSPITNIHFEPNHTHVVQTCKEETPIFNFSHVTSPDSKQGTTSIGKKSEQFASTSPSSSIHIKNAESAFIHFAEAMVSQPLLPVNTATSSNKSLQNPNEDQGMDFLQWQIMQDHNYCSAAEVNENSCLWTKDNSEQNSQRQFLATVISKDHDYCLPSNEPKHQFVLKKEISKKSNHQVVSKKYIPAEDETQQSKLSKPPSQMQLDSSFAKESSHNILPTNHKGNDDSNSKICNSDFKKDENNLCHKIVESKENDDSGLEIKYEKNIDDSNQEIKHMKFQSETSISIKSSNDIIGNNKKLYKSMCFTDQQNHDEFYKKPLDSNFSENKIDRFDSMAELNKTTDSDSKLENANKNIFPTLSSFNVCNTSKLDSCNEQIQKLSPTNQESLNNKTIEHLNNAEKSGDKVEDTDANPLTKVSDSREIFMEENSCTNNSSNEHIQKLSSTNQENLNNKTIEHLNNAEKSDDKVEDTGAKSLTKVSDSREIFMEENSCTNNSSNEHIQKLSSTNKENLNNKTIEHLNNAEKSDDKVEDTDAKSLTKVSDSRENIYFKNEIFIEEDSCINNSSNEHIQKLSSTNQENLNNKIIEQLNNAEKSDDKVEDTGAKSLTKVSDSREIFMEENSCTNNSSNEHIQKLSSTNKENLNNKTIEHLNNAEKSDDKVEDTNAKSLTKVSDSRENIYFKNEIFIEEDSCINNSSNEHIQKLSSTNQENLNNKTIEQLNNAEKSEDKVEDTDAKSLTKVSDSREIFMEENSCTNNSSNEHIQKLSSTNQENLNNKTIEQLNSAEKPDDKVEDTDAKSLTKVSDSREIFMEENSCTNNSSNEHIQKLSSTNQENLNNKTIEQLNNAEKSDDKVEDTDAKPLTKVSDSHENIYSKSEIFIEEDSCINKSSNEHIQKLSSANQENLNNKTTEHLNNAEKFDDKVEDTDAKFLTKVSDSHKNIYFKSEIFIEKNSCTNSSSHNDSRKEGICTGDASDVTISDLFKKRDTSDSSKDTAPKADSHKDHCINVSSANGEILTSDLKDSDRGNNQNSSVQKYKTGKTKTKNSDIELNIKCDNLKTVISNSNENLNSNDNSNKESNENLISGINNNYNDSQCEIRISDYSNKESSANGLSVIKNVYEDSQTEIKRIDFGNKEPTENEENGLSVIKNVYDDSQHEIKKIDYSNKEPNENALSVIKNDYEDSQQETEDSDYNNKESSENLIKNDDSQLEIQTSDYEQQKFDHNEEIEKCEEKFVIFENDDSHETSDPCDNQNKSDQSNETVEFIEFDSYDSKLREFDNIWERSNSIENLNNSTEDLSRRQHSHLGDDKRKKERKHRKRKHIHSVGNHETRDHNHLIETHRKKEHSHSTESYRMKEIGPSHMSHRRREHSHSSRSRKKSEHHHSVKSPRKSKKSSPRLYKSPRKQLSGTKEHSSHLKKTMDEQDDTLLYSTKSYHSSRSPESIRNFNSQRTLSPESMRKYSIYHMGSPESIKSYNIYHMGSPESIKNYNPYYIRSPESIKNFDNYHIRTPESIKNCHSYRTILPESYRQHSRSPESLKSRSPKSAKKLRDHYYQKVSERLAGNDYNKFVDSNKEQFESVNINDSSKESHHVELKKRRGRHRSRRKRNILTDLPPEVTKADERSLTSEKGFNDNHFDSNKEIFQSVGRDNVPRTKERLQSISRDNICRSKERLQNINKDNVSKSNERLQTVSRDDLSRNKGKLQSANREKLSRSKERLQSVSREDISRKERLQSISRDDIPRKEKLQSISKDDISRKERLQSVSRDDISRKERLQSVSRDVISRKERLQSVSRDDISRKERLQSVSREDISRKERLQSVSRDDISRKERLQHISRDEIARKERLQHISRSDIARKERSQSISGDGIARNERLQSVNRDDVSRKERLQSVSRDDISRKERLQSVSRDETFRSKERLQSISRDDISRNKERLQSVNRDGIARNNGRLQSVNRDNTPRNKKRLHSISRDDLSKNKDRHHDDNLKMRRRRRSSTPKDLPCLSLKAYKYVCSTPADDYYYSKEKDSKEVFAKDALKALHEKFRYELVERAERVRASKPKYDPPKRKTKLRKPKPPKTDSNSDSSSSSEKSSSEEEDTSMEELERKKKHPYRLHLELWFNDPKEMNDGPLCRCSAKARRAGIRHGIYVGEDHLPLCNPLSNNVDRLYHYRITMTPHTNFLTKNPTTIHHNGQSYRFEGFSMFSHSKLPPLPNCKVIRFNYEYTIVYAEEEFPKNFTVEGLELFSRYLLVEILELVDLNWKAHDDPDGCPRFHFMPRFTRELRDGGKEMLSHCYVLDYLVKQNQILVDEKKLSKVLALNNLDWQDLADEVKGMIITCPGMKPSSIRVDQLDREQCVPDKEEFPVIVHFGVRPPQLSYAGNPHYQKAWRDYVKYRHLLANKPKVRYADRHRLLQKEVRLQEMRMENDLKRDVTVVISSKEFYKTGIMSDIVQHAMLLPVLVCHLRFHQSLTHLENKLGYKFQDRFLLQLALTHPSYRENFGTNPDHARNSLTNCGLRQPQYGDRRIHYMNTRKRGINTLINIMSRFGSRTETLSRINHNERLEFLGDAVVEFLSSIHLFYMFPDLEEGGLATYRAAIVQNQHLAVLSKKLELDRFMLYAHGSDLCHDLELRHAMANCFEALMGALFLDNGIEIADKVFSKTLFLELELLEVWMNFSPHPLQEQEPHGDRKWIESVPLLQKLHKFEETIGIEFNHIRLLARALTHRSLGYNNLTLGSNQRLEFLGDTVLQLVASEYLYKFFPEHHEGHLSLLRSSLVNNRTQAVVCADLGMVDYAIYPYDKVELKPKDKADLLEAFLGALYVDKDLGYCRKFCEVCFFPRLQDFIMNQDWNDPKSKLQQCCLTLRSMDGGEPDIPTYKVIECKGPTNTRVYSVAVYFQGNRLAVGSGHSIQQAEMDAASNALNMSKDLFPQLRHQRRAIERSLKKRPLNKNKFSLKKDKEKIFDKSKHLPKKGKEKSPGKSKHSPKKDKEKFFGKIKQSMPKKYKERLFGKIKYSPKKDKDKTSDFGKPSPKKHKEKIFDKSKNLPKKYKIKTLDKSKHLSAKDETTSDKHKNSPMKEENIFDKQKHSPTKEEEKTSDKNKHLVTKEVEKTSDKSKHLPAKEIEDTFDKSMHLPTKEVEKTSDKSKHLPTKEVEKTSDKSKHLPTKIERTSDKSKHLPTKKVGKISVKSKHLPIKEVEKTSDRSKLSQTKEAEKTSDKSKHSPLKDEEKTSDKSKHSPKMDEEMTSEQAFTEKNS